MNSEFVEQFAKAEGTAFVSGNSVGRPQGILENSSVGNTAGPNDAIDENSLITVAHSV